MSRQSWTFDTTGTACPAQLIAVPVGQLPVDDDQVERCLVERGKRSSTSLLQLDVITRRRKACAVGRRCRARVNQQYTHPGAGSPGEQDRCHGSNGHYTTPAQLVRHSSSPSLSGNCQLMMIRSNGAWLSAASAALPACSSWTS